MTIQSISNEILNCSKKQCIVSYDIIYCIEYSYLVLDTIYFARSRFCLSEVPKEDLHCLKSRMLHSKDVNYYIDYLQEQDEIWCRKIHGRTPSPFYNIGFITFDNTNNPKCNITTSRCARGKNIFNMRYVFIPIHHCLHFTCAVIYMGQMKSKYYNSLCFDNVTRHGCRHTVKTQEDTLQVLRHYLQNEHMKDKRIDLLNE
jgi:Ulp1 family protease